MLTEKQAPFQCCLKIIVQLRVDIYDISIALEGGGGKVRGKDRKTFGAEFEESEKKGGWGLKARGCLFPRVESDRNVAWGRESSLPLSYPHQPYKFFIRMTLMWY